MDVIIQRKKCIGCPWIISNFMIFHCNGQYPFGSIRLNTYEMCGIIIIMKWVNR